MLRRTAKTGALLPPKGFVLKRSFATFQHNTRKGSSLSYLFGAATTVACTSILYSSLEADQYAHEDEGVGSKIEIQSSREDIFKEARQIILQAKEEQGYPGCSVTVMKKGKTVWSQGFGMADVENMVPMTSKHVMRIASLSKAITATAVGLLYEQGKLDLDAPIQQYIPSFQPPNPLPPSQQANQKQGMTSTNPANANGNPQASSLPPSTEQEVLPEGEAAKRITTRLLAGHLGGIRHYNGPAEITSKRKYSSVTDALNAFKSDPMVAIPGERYVYTTYGWTLISAVIEVASGEEFMQFMKKNVFDALGMKNTCADQHDPIIPFRAKYYRRVNGKLVNAPWVDNSVKWAGGGLLSNTEDLVIFGNSMIKAEILKKQTITMMFTSQKTKSGVETGYGIGWSIDTAKKTVFSAQDGDRTVQDWIVSHGGGAVGAASTLMLLPDEDIVVAIIVNLEGAATRPTAERLAYLFKQYQ